MNLFQSFDFALLGSPEFKEDSVREALISPILHALGYSDSGPNKIIRSKGLASPFVKMGSKKQKITLIPDYLLTVDNKYAWVLDAKGPNEPVVSGNHLEQIYSYAIHPDVRVNFYALCNGREFVLYQIGYQDAILYFQLSEIEQYWLQLQQLLSPAAFQKRLVKEKAKAPYFAPPVDYLSKKPLGEIKDLKKQSANRHYGVHGYFTKQVWNVVQEYIKHFTQPGDTVLDPFGGSGVTVVEALVLGRKGIHIDLNPLSIFLVENLLAPVNLSALADAYQTVKKQFMAHQPKTESEIEAALAKYPYPKEVSLPRNSDVPFLEQLFSREQLAQLAYLKHLIQQIKDKTIRGILMLMFSSLVNQINLTYHASEGRSAGRGDSSAFRYYRYRLAPEPSMLDVVERMDLRFKKIIKAKRELAPLITEDVLQEAQIYKGSATSLADITSESVDYIYTDPPYGAKIPYLDLSVMWNAWLDLPVTTEDYEQEAIEGGELGKSKEDYSDLLADSIREMYRVLKFNRWMSFVFAHKDPAFWHLIVDTAERAGFEYAGAVKQSNNKTTYKKRQNPFTVLEGQLIINFRKVRNPQAIMRIELGADIADIVVQTIEGVIAQNEGATLEEINDELIIKGLELGFLDVLSKEYQDISPFLADNFDYDDKTKKFQIRPNTKFKSQIDVRLRIRYYLISFLRRKEKEHEFPTFDEIVLHIMPLLKNGRTPENQTILSVLEEIAVRVGHDRWRLSNTNIQLPLL